MTKWLKLFESLAWEEIESKLSTALDRHFGLGRNSIRPFNVYIRRKRTFPDKVVYKKVVEGDSKHYQMKYVVDSDNNIVFTSEPEQITFTEEPVKKESLVEAATMTLSQAREKINIAIAARFGQHTWVSDIETEDNKVNKGHAIFRLDDGCVSSRAPSPTLKIAYTINKEGVAVLGADTEPVEYKYVPITVNESVPVGQFLYEAEGKNQGRQGSVWRVVLIKAGTSLNGNHYPKTVLKEAVSLFENVNAMARSDEEHVNDSAKSVKNIVGFFQDVKFEEGKITADFHILKSAEWLREGVLDAWQRGKKDLIGFSIVAEGTGRLKNSNGKTIRMVESIKKVNSVDVVVDPAAGGKFLKLVASNSEATNHTIEEEKETMEKLLKLLEAVAPDLFKTIDPENVTEDKVVELITEAKTKEPDTKKVEALELQLSEAQNELKASTDSAAKAKADADAEAVKLAEAKAKEQKDKEAATAKAKADEEKDELTKIRESMTEMRDGLKKDQCALRLTEALSKSNLPAPAQDVIRKKYADRIYDEAELTSEIEDQRTVFSTLAESGQVSGIDFVRSEVGDSERDKTLKAFDGFFNDENVDDVPRFDSFREAYIKITGDVGLTGNLKNSPNLGKFTEALTSASWGEVLGDSITRRMLKEYRLPELDSWKKVVSDITNVKDFRTNRRMRIGGYGELPTVAENGSYTALSSPTDEEATYAVSKKGGTETITMEMIANDDVGSIRRIPVKLARAAKITLMRAVFDPIRDNDTCTYDSVALFHATHANLATGALTATTLNAAKVAMRSQAGYNNSIEILGLTPKWLLVPEELEDAAFRLTASNTLIDATNNSGTEPNIHSNYGLKHLVVPYWADGTDWAVVCDPKDCPTLEVGFFNGRREPELFVADRQESGASMFTNDQIKYKIRFIFGVAILDHRGMYKGVVAGT